MNAVRSDTTDIKVSVVMITYNHERFIAQAIEGVLMQRTDFVIELVIGEDCSTDGTRAIVRSYGERYPERIRLILPERNQGARTNFAETLSACRGQYIAICEGDDYWTDSLKLQKQVDFLESHPNCSLCFHKVLIVYEDGSAPSTEFGPKERKATYSLEDFLNADLMQTASLVFRRDALGEYPPWYYQVPIGDWVGITLLGQHGDMGYIDEVMSVYRRHSGGIWSGQSKTVQVQQQLVTLGMMDAHLGYRYHKAVEYRTNILCARIAQALVQQETLATSNHSQVSRPAVVLERCGATGSLSATQEAQILSGFYTSLFFFHHEGRNHVGVRHCLPYVVRYNPPLLRNKGVWSIGAEAMLGPRIAGLLRKLVRRLCPRSA